MTQTEIERLQELRQKEHLTEKEFAQWEFLEKKVINDERIEQFRKNQQEPYSSKRSRAVNLAWEFFRAVEGRCYVAVEAKRQSEAVIQTSLFGTDGS